MTTEPAAARGSFLIPEIIKGPWTLAARQLAVDKECLQHFIEYFGKALKTRRWSPWHDLPIEEMKKFGDRLTQETINLIEGFLGVEEYVGDYVEEGLRCSATIACAAICNCSGVRRNWHGVAWRKRCCIPAHARAVAGVLRQGAGASLDDQNHSGRTAAGCDGVCDGARTCHVLQLSGNRARIRLEYGLPQAPTEEERARLRVGASKRFAWSAWTRCASRHLLADRADSSQYLPEKTLDTIQQVLQGFQMPSLRLIPNARNFIRAVAKTEIHNAEKHKTFIHNPVLKALGLEDNDAFNRAVQAAKLLPANLGPDRVRLGRTGEFVIAY
jgi:acyl-[acyl-carrier-protein] desaturase